MLINDAKNILVLYNLRESYRSFVYHARDCDLGVNDLRQDEDVD